jgi:hypothetical protein
VRLSDHDFSRDGLTIRAAFVKASEGYTGPVVTPPRESLSIVWNGRDVVTGDIVTVPTRGHVIIERLGGSRAHRQGVDVQATGGGIQLRDGSVPLLRTWFDPGLPDRCEYRYQARDGLLDVCNVYVRTYPNGRVVAEKWTGNAGMLVEHVSDHERVYRCSAGWARTPTFDDLIYRILIEPTADSPHPDA